MKHYRKIVWVFIAATHLLFGLGDNATPQGLYQKYQEAFAAQRYPQAINALSKLITQQEHLHEDNFTIAQNRYSLAVAYHYNTNYTKALELLHQVEPIYQQNPNQQEHYGYILGWIANCYQQLQQLPKALHYYQKALDIQEKILGKEHPSVTTTYDYMGRIYSSMGEYPKALKYYQKALSNNEKTLGKEHINTATSYNGIGGLYHAMGEYAKALDYYQKSLAIYVKNLGKEHAYIATSYGNMAKLYSSIGKYNKALEYYQEALAIQEKLLGKEHTMTAQTYRDIGFVYHAQGNYPKALSYYQKALVIQEAQLGTQHTATAQTYSNLGGLYTLMGEYPKALEYYQKALAIYETVLGKEHSYTAIIYSYLGGLYETMGEYDRSLHYHQKAVAIQEKTLGKEHTTTAVSYNYIARLYQTMQKFPKALEYYQKALAIDEKVYGTQHTETATTYDNIAGLYMLMHQSKEALNFFEKALAIKEKVFGTEHTTTAVSYNNMAILYKMMGNYPKALEYYQKALSIRQKYLGNEHPLLALSYNGLCTVYLAMHDYAKAYRYAHASFESFIINRDKNFPILNNQQKELYLKSNSSVVPVLLSTTYDYLESNASTAIKAKTLNAWIGYKGSIFDSENAIMSLYNTTDQELKKLLDRLIDAKRALAKLYQSIPKPKERQNWQAQITQTKEQINKFTQEIATHAQSFQKEQGLKSINYHDISNNLKTDQLYIDYAKMDKNYYLFSLDSQGTINFEKIDSNDTHQIDQLVAQFRSDIQSILTDRNLTQSTLDRLKISSKSTLAKLYQLALLKPLGGELNAKKSLIISSDGALRLLPFEALFDGKNYLIENKEIGYIPSGKELVRLYRYTHRDRNTTATRAVIINNPSFDDKVVASSSTPSKNRSGIIKSLFKMHFAPLPGTKAEAKNIKKILKPTNKITEYHGKAASEENLLTIKSPTILHIATHGFFLNDNTIPNPMLKSGIALSGANTSAKFLQDRGIVTSLKLAGLNLQDTQLVVLSACQTGLVDINSTESLSGLSKAFIQAGAQHIVTSLWSVDDQATQKLMSSFYQKMQGTPQYATALKNAKLEMIAKDQHPFYWAAFVLGGISR